MNDGETNPEVPATPRDLYGAPPASFGSPFRALPDWSARWPAGVWWSERTDSTNAEALRRPAEDLAPGRIFAADYQTAGRGRHARSWRAEAGTSLMMSLAFARVSELGPFLWLHLALGAAICDAVEDLAGGPIKQLGVKWPNDVVQLDEEAPAGYRKLAGILTESATEPDGGPGRRVAIGTGINVTQAPEAFPAELRASATSLTILGVRTTPLELLAALLPRLAPLQERLLVDDVEPVREVIRRRMILSGHVVTATIRDRTFDLRVEGLDRDGRLVGSTIATGERLHLDAGEITQVRPRRPRPRDHA